MGISRTTRLNWILDAGVFFTALVADFSGLYFLYVPVGGYQGGKNPLYGITILFSRSTWDDLHLWGGVAMILIVTIHLLYHWDWVVMMTKKIWNQIRSLFGPTGGYEGGANANWDIGFLFSRTTWDLIHTWSGVTLFIAASFHFLIHWKWIKKVTNRFFQTQPPVVRHGA